MTFSLLLENILDINPVPYKEKSSGSNRKFLFKIKNVPFMLSIMGNTKSMGIAFHSYDKGDNKNDITITKTAFATIIDIIKKTINEEHPDMLSMSSATPSRFRIYRNLAKTFADKLGYRVEAEGNYVYLIKKGLKR